MLYKLVIFFFLSLKDLNYSTFGTRPDLLIKMVTPSTLGLSHSLNRFQCHILPVSPLTLRPYRRKGHSHLRVLHYGVSLQSPLPGSVTNFWIWGVGRTLKSGLIPPVKVCRSWTRYHGWSTCSTLRKTKNGPCWYPHGWVSSWPGCQLGVTIPGPQP